MTAASVSALATPSEVASYDAAQNSRFTRTSPVCDEKNNFCRQNIRPVTTAILPVIKYETEPQIFLTKGGQQVLGETSTVAIEVDSDQQEAAAIEILRSEAAVKADGTLPYPSQTVVAAPEDVDSRDVRALENAASKTIRLAPEAKTVIHLPKNREDKSWWAAHHNKVYAVTRFLLNGLCIYSSFYFLEHVPMAAALVTAGLAGGIAGVLQWHLDPYSDILNRKDVYKKIRIKTKSEKVDPTWANMIKKKYNKLAFNAESFGRWYLTEAVFLAVMESSLMAMGAAHPSLLEFGALTAGTAVMSTASQGVAELAIFNNAKVEEKFSLHSEIHRSVVKNTSAFLISAASTTVAVLKMVAAMGGINTLPWLKPFVIPLIGSISVLGLHIPIGFIGISSFGLALFLKAYLVNRKQAKLRELAIAQSKDDDKGDSGNGPVDGSGAAGLGAAGDNQSAAHDDDPSATCNARLTL